MQINADGANVKWKRKELRDILPQYTLIQDCIDGETAVKKKGTKYLPQPNAADDSEANELRYDAYLTRAVFYNVTARTQRGLVGQVFLRPPIINVPDALNSVVENTDGSGINIVQSSQTTMGQVVAKGRGGLFSDYPTTEGVSTRAELEDGDIQPTITFYDPEKIINWRVKTRGAKTIISMVVLEEKYESGEDTFELIENYQYRVLYLDDGDMSDELYDDESSSSDIYRVCVYRPDKEGLSITEEYTPTDATGATLNEIPFTFVGSENNDYKVDNPLMYDIASLNVAHYRNSADYEESSYMVGQPTVWISGLTEDWWTNVMGKQLQLGSRGGIPLPQDGSAGLLQADPNQMPKEGMEHKERQMVSLGAQVVEQRQVERTATEAVIENSAEVSALGVAADNVSAAYTICLQWCAMFIGAETQDIIYKLNTDFDIAKLSPQEQQQLIQSWMDGVLSFGEVRESFRKSGIATLDDEEAKKEIAAHRPEEKEPQEKDTSTENIVGM